jgi:hypothetical protein
MSIERVERRRAASSGACPGGRPARTARKSLARKRDAEAFDAELRREKRTGEMAVLDAG